MKTFNKLNTPARVIEITEYNAAKPSFTELMSNDNGAIVLIVLKKDQKIAEHLAPEDVMVYTAQGEAQFTVEGEEKRLFQGDCMLMKKGTPHSVKALTDTMIILTKIRA